LNAGINLAQQYLSLYNGNASDALNGINIAGKYVGGIIPARIAACGAGIVNGQQQYTSLSTQCDELRDADQYLYADEMASSGLYGLPVGVLWGLGAAGTLFHQALHVGIWLEDEVPSLWGQGIQDQDPPSTDAIEAGFDGLNAAVTASPAWAQGGNLITKLWNILTTWPTTP
jgi:hypothetical protein